MAEKKDTLILGFLFPAEGVFHECSANTEMTLISILAKVLDEKEIREKVPAELQELWIEEISSGVFADPQCTLKDLNVLSGTLFTVY